MGVIMQHFNINDLPLEDQKTVRKFYSRMGAGYAALLLLGVISILFRSPHSGLDDHVAAGAKSVTGMFTAVASEAPNRTICAERDLKVISLLNQHGDAQDVPANDLRNAFFALMDARKACSSGRLQEALAIYDRVTFSGGQAMQRQ
jgi:hypothetical protein